MKPRSMGSKTVRACLLTLVHGFGCRRLCLVQIELHAHLTVHVDGNGPVLSSLLGSACALVQLAEPEMAVGDDRPHAARLGERQGPAIMGFTSRGVQLVAMCRDVT